MKRIFYAFVLLIVSITLHAQAPQSVCYQAVATDQTGHELVSQNIKVRLSILKGSASGTEEWVETHAVTTDGFGLFDLQIGNGTRTGGAQTTLSNVRWGNDKHFLKVEMDITGGNNYVLMGTNQLVSVPYALYAERSFSATFADSSGKAGRATNADFAATAGLATRASLADSAIAAGRATTAMTANRAIFSDSAAASGRATTATTATRAIFSDSAAASGRATTAMTATRAIFSDSAAASGRATTAMTATRAIFSDSAASAGRATTAMTATRAMFSDSAAVAGRATTAMTATRAIFADSAAAAGRSVTATTATRAIFSDSAASAGRATTAMTATRAMFADSAAVAGRATTAMTATRAIFADSAAAAGRSVTATTATRAIFADSASKSQSSQYARTASRADTASFAWNADSSRRAGQAQRAIVADSSNRAQVAWLAINANKAITADSAGRAGSAARADTARVALIAAGDLDGDPTNEIQSLMYRNDSLILTKPTGPPSVVNLSTQPFRAPGASIEFPIGIMGEAVTITTNFVVPNGKALYVSAVNDGVQLADGKVLFGEPGMPIIPEGYRISQCYCTGILLPNQPDVVPIILDFTSPSFEYLVPAGYTLVIKSGKTTRGLLDLQIDSDTYSFYTVTSQSPRLIVITSGKKVKKPITLLPYDPLIVTGYLLKR